jgi:hypothetical protein
MGKVIKIPFKGKMYQNVDEIEFTGNAPFIMDGWVDELGNTHKRPGLVEWTDLETDLPVDGLKWDNNLHCGFAVSGGKTFKLSDSEGTPEDITTDYLLKGTRPSIATISTPAISSGFTTILANGGRMVTYDNTETGRTQYVGDESAPDAVMFLADLNGLLLSLPMNSIHFNWVDNTLIWDALNFATNEVKAGNIRGMVSGWDEVLLFNGTTIEFWMHSGAQISSTAVIDFMRKDNTSVEQGLGAIWSLLPVDNTWFFINTLRKLVRLKGRTPEIISTPIDKILQYGEGIDGMKADHVNVGGKALYLMQFPDSGKTLVYDYQNNDWSQWGLWNKVRNEYTPWVGNCVTYIPDWNIHAVGSRLDSKIYKMSDNYFDDAGTPIRTVRRTGWIDHDTSVRKRCNKLTFKFKRGSQATYNKAYAVLRWRDDGSEQWREPRILDLGARGESEFLLDEWHLGIYRSRQYEIDMSDSANFILVDCEGNVDLMVN